MNVWSDYLLKIGIIFKNLLNLKYSTNYTLELDELGNQAHYHIGTNPEKHTLAFLHI